MKTKAILSVLVLLAVYCPLATVHCFSAVPSLINYQGVLKDSLGVPYHGNATMVFSIWSDSTGGTNKWEETQAIVSVSHGLFNVLLGSSNPIPDSVFLKPSAWLQVIANGNQLSPRRRIVSVGYAYKASEADTAVYARTAPDYDWQIDTSGFNIYRMTGNVGIGTTAPQTTLHVRDGGIIIGMGIGGCAGSGKIVQDCDLNVTKFQSMNNNVWSDAMVIAHTSNVGLGTTNPQEKLDVEGNVQAYAFNVGDIFFQKDKEKLWRMFEDDEGLYLENLKTGKVFRFILQEVEKK